MQKCDKDYRPLKDGLISINQYLSFLQTHYDMELEGLTFRNAIGRSIRVYKRETLDEEHPLHQAKQETAKSAIEGLLKLTDLYSGIEAQSKVTAEAKDKYSTFKKAQKYQYIPFVTKQSDYNKNEGRIAELTAQAEEGSYTPKTQKILEATKVLQLSPGAGALFGRTWNDVERT